MNPKTKRARRATQRRLDEQSVRAMGIPRTLEALARVCHTKEQWHVQRAGWGGRRDAAAFFAELHDRLGAICSDLAQGRMGNAEAETPRS